MLFFSSQRSLLTHHLLYHLYTHSKGEYKIAYELFKHNNNGCAKHSAGTFLSDVGGFAEAYVLQNQYESFYTYAENKYGNPDSLDYVTCRAFEEANDDGSFTYVKLGCSDAGGLKLHTYSDSSCTQEITNSLGIYNDVKVRFSVLQHRHHVTVSHFLTNLRYFLSPFKIL